MWYTSPSQDQDEPAPSSEILHAAEPDRRTVVREHLESSEPGLPAKALARSMANKAPAGPGSEYWLP